MNKKRISTFGVCIGVLLIILGIVMAFGGMGGKTDRAYVQSSGLLSSDYGVASFGADFYTYVNNNAANAASAARVAANNLDELSRTIHFGLGLILVAMGAFTACFFGVKSCEYKELEATNALTEEKVEENKENVTQTAAEQDQTARIEENDSGKPTATDSENV